MNLKKEYFNFLNQNFEGLEVKKPLFYNWNLGLRFDLQKDFTNPVDIENKEYFKEVYNRAEKLFEFCFDQEEEIYLSIFSYKRKRQRIRKTNYIFKLIKNEPYSNYHFDKVSNRYESNEKWNTLIIKDKIKNINIADLINGLCNTDFPMMKPSIPEEVYIMNIDKKIIFHIYDDRGLDILSSNKKILIDLYDQFDKWVLEYDREQIKKQLDN